MKNDSNQTSPRAEARDLRPLCENSAVSDLSSAPEKAPIAGITGQDGSYLVGLLLSKGPEVHGLIRRSSSLSTGRIDHRHRDELCGDAGMNPGRYLMQTALEPGS